jgi:hypothetical protein
MQSADSFADIGESASSCGWQTIHIPFMSIAGNKRQNASLRSINRQACITGRPKTANWDLGVMSYELKVPQNSELTTLNYF